MPNFCSKNIKIRNWKCARKTQSTVSCQVRFWYASVQLRTFRILDHVGLEWTYSRPTFRKFHFLYFR